MNRQAGRLSFTSIIMISFVLLTACIDPYADWKRESNNKNRIAEKFIRAIGDGDEEKAISYLSTTTKSAVELYCLDGSILNCLESDGRVGWSNPEHIVFEGGIAEASAFTIVSEKHVIHIIILSEKENNRWVVSGWRGVGPDDDLWPDGYLEGSDPIESFPPVQESVRRQRN